MATNNISLSEGGEPPPATTSDHRSRGGWTTAPFIIATMFLLTLGSGCGLSNLIVFLIKEFNIKSIDAAQITNVVIGCGNFFPLVGAILADSLLGCFSVIWISSLICLLGSILLVLTATVDALRPNISATHSSLQYAVLYSSLALTCIGIGGARFTLATMGANQFTKPNHQSTYFNWYFFSLYSAAFIAATGIVYVEDNFSWGWGFGIGVGANALGLALFLIGRRFYIRDKPRTSPFTSLLRVVVASVRKRKAVISSVHGDYYYGDDGVKGIIQEPPTKSFRSLNRASLKTEGDILPNGKISTPWKICTVQQVEDLKSVIRILPLWSSSIFLSTPIGVQLSLTVLQALATNRHLRRSFQFPASSIIVFSFLSTFIAVALLDHSFLRLYSKLSGGNRPTPLQQIGIGHVLNVASMAISALVESKRRHSNGHISVAWLVPQMVVVGIGEAFHFPGQVRLYYQEFPSSLKSLATAMVAMLIGVAFYLSSGVIDLIRRVADWLPDNIDYGRVDCVYWVMVVIGSINFGYFLVISWFYNYKYVQVVKGDLSVSSE